MLIREMASAKSEKFGKRHRITRRMRFEQIYRSGRKVQNEHFRIYFKCEESEAPQLGIAVTKRVGKAVVRNRLKRQIREWFRTHKATLDGMALIVQAKPPAASLEYEGVVDALNRLILTANRR